MKPKLQWKPQEVKVMVGFHVSLAESAERVIRGDEGMKTQRLQNSVYLKMLEHGMFVEENHEQT